MKKSIIFNALVAGALCFSLSGCMVPGDQDSSHRSSHSKPATKGRVIVNEGLISSLRSSGIVVIQRGQILRLVLPHGLFFDPYNANQLKPSQLPTMRRIASLLRNYYPSSPIRVIGYTDSSGTQDEQEDRARRSAEVIYSYLWDHGVSSGRMQLLSYGSKQPVGSEKGFFTGWSDNRRVEIRVGLPPA